MLNGCIMLSYFGKVLAEFIPGRRGKGKCFNFVLFRDRRLAVKVVEAMNESSLGGRRLVINLAKFE